MNLKEILETLKDSKTFKDWILRNPTAYLCSCFSNNNKDWQFCFYSPKKDKITTFLNNKILQSDSEIFRKEKTKVKELKIEDVKIYLSLALKIAEKTKEKYSKEKPGKEIMILQNVTLPIWNITYLLSLNILNIKIDAITGKIISESLDSVTDFKVK